MGGWVGYSQTKPSSPWSRSVFALRSAIVQPPVVPPAARLPFGLHCYLILSGHDYTDVVHDVTTVFSPTKGGVAHSTMGRGQVVCVSNPGGADPYAVGIVRIQYLIQVGGLVAKRDVLILQDLQIVAMFQNLRIITRYKNIQHSFRMHSDFIYIQYHVKQTSAHIYHLTPANRFFFLVLHNSTSHRVALIQ